MKVSTEGGGIKKEKKQLSLSIRKISRSIEVISDSNTSALMNFCIIIQVDTSNCFSFR